VPWAASEVNNISAFTHHVSNHLQDTKRGAQGEQGDDVPAKCSPKRLRIRMLMNFVGHIVGSDLPCLERSPPIEAPVLNCDACMSLTWSSKRDAVDIRTDGSHDRSYVPNFQSVVL
jgi:hypothetical protein